MTRRALRFAAGTVLAAGLLLPLAPQRASACDVSYDYKPSLDLRKHDFGHGHTCSTGTSLGGVTIVVLLAFGALSAAAATAYKRGAATAGGPSSGPGTSLTLTAYLQATGLNLAPKPTGRPPGAPPAGYPVQPPRAYPPPQYPPGPGFHQPPPGYGPPPHPGPPPYAGPPPQAGPPQARPPYGAPGPWNAPPPPRPPAPRPAPPQEQGPGGDDAPPAS
ncbi:hypothetical protein ACQPZ8_40095 [Actinomadura nitritigenes]|uniref:hypothetical protein n=1 Tax=Actinomadura nitritigenes TaxID=134602 RepID=UPI003D8ABFEA